MELKGRPIDAAKLADFVIDLWSVNLLSAGLGASLALTLRSICRTLWTSPINEHCDKPAEYLTRLHVASTCIPSCMYLLMQNWLFGLTSLHFEHAFSAIVGPSTAFMAQGLHLCARPSAFFEILRKSALDFH